MCDSSQLSDHPRESFDQNRQGRKEQHLPVHPSMSKDRDTFSPVGENHGSSHHHNDRKTSNVGDSLSDCDILDLGDECYESLDGSRAYDASLMMIRKNPPPLTVTPSGYLFSYLESGSSPSRERFCIAVVVTTSRTISKVNKTANRLLKKLVIRPASAITLANVTMMSRHGAKISSQFNFRIRVATTTQSPSWQ